MLSPEQLATVERILQTEEAKLATEAESGPLTADQEAHSALIAKVQEGTNKRKRETEQKEHVLSLLREMPLADAMSTIRQAVLEFPGCCRGLRKCQDCGNLVSEAQYHEDVRSYKNYTRNVCDACCFWCSSCEEEFCAHGEYRHEDCKTRKFLDDSEDEDEEDEDDEDEGEKDEDEGEKDKDE